MAPVHPVDIPLPLPLTPTHEEHDKPMTRRGRSSKFVAITTWALAVQPGSPAPISPNRLPHSHRRAPSNSTSFLHIIDTPTTAGKSIPSPRSPKNFAEVDMTNWGYTSVFVHLPVTPSTPSHLRRRSPVTPEAPVKPGKGIKKFKSMGILRRNAKSVAGDVSPTSPTPRTRARSRSRSGSVSPTKASMSGRAAGPSKSKARTKNHPPLPPALQTELLLMQFTGGGSLETNAQRLMEQRAKATTTKAVDAVYKDENGMMWLDEDERIEYQGLIPSSPIPSSPASSWVQFSSFAAALPSSPALGAIRASEEPVRRGSVKSLTPTERELEAATPLQPSSPTTYIGISLVSTASIANADRSERRRRRRPAPLKLHSAPAVLTASAAQGFEDSFEPTSAELVAMAAGMQTHARATRANGVRRAPVRQLGSAPADVSDFDVTVVEVKDGRIRGKRMGFAKRAKALFGME
ncbi:hypothetical protein V5O48_012470 [Marasmius crinis-equi]|uniref:Uncharacterized protein n=1 Tax=Marasmius crinis-equi TaxID=585013 RepID=A0ABR3F2R7_9AGAR